MLCGVEGRWYLRGNEVWKNKRTIKEMGRTEGFILGLLFLELHLSLIGFNGWII